MRSFYKNEYLFSEIYLQEITQVEEDPAVKATLSALKEYRDYADKSNLEAWNVSFVHEIFNALRFGVKKIDGNTALLYQLGSDAIITLCYSLLPSEDLDSTTMGQNWSEKIIRNLRNNQLKWGILTNGDQWRIYHSEEPTPYENYLEIDLKGIMDAENVPQYQIFNKFMKAENFIPDKDGNCQFDIFKKESQDRINYIEEELKNALKQKEEGGKGILSNICMGYVDYLRKNEDPDLSDEGLRDTIYAGAMLYMFRLLFVFYAKARSLLKESNRELFSSVLAVAQEIHEQGDTGKDEYLLWHNLRELFSNIDLTYNGGLFNPAENEFVEEKRLSNNYLASVIYYMTFYEDKAGDQQLISYRDMGVRHLGSLYEGLLEHKLFIAEEDTEVKVTNNEVKFIPVSEGGKVVEGRYIPIGQVYFGNDKGMRKASGSYYTPEYIVDYIVQNTVGERLNELRDTFIKNNKSNIVSLETAINEKEVSSFSELLKTNIEDFIQNEILKFSVLDPAMGSGHFLVNATNNVSNFLVEFSNNFNIITDKDTSTIFWLRRVIENCIFGVDINFLAVELTKLSLWILSMAKDQPLSFLDHHLKCGDALTGAMLSEVGEYPGKKNKIVRQRRQLRLFENNQNFKNAVKTAIEKYNYIISGESKRLGDIGNKKQWLEEINDTLLPYKSICDFHTNVHFDDNISQVQYEDQVSSFSPDFGWNKAPYFHWEIEYPEIFFKKKGFDCIVTNPPYVGFKEANPAYRPFLSAGYNEIYNGKADIYYFFIYKSLRIGNENAKIGYITSRYWLEAETAYLLRNYIDKNKIGHCIYDFSDLHVFEGVGTKCAINFFYNNKHTASCYIFKDELKAKFKNSLTENDINFFFKYKSIKQVSNEKWQFLRPDEYSLINKISDNSIKAGDIGSTKQGVVTGKDAAFVYSKETIDKYKIETNYLKKWLKIGDILPFIHRQREDLFLNYLNERDNIDDLPHTSEYLDKYKKSLLNRRECKAGKIEYFHLQWGRKKEFFEKPKLISRKISPINCFIAEFNQYYSGADTTIFIPYNSSEFVIYFLLGYFNSNLATFYFQSYAKRMDYRFEYLPTPVAQIFVPKFLADEYELNYIIKDYSKECIRKESKTARLAKEISNLEYRSEKYERSVEQINVLINQYFKITSQEEKLFINISKHRWDK